MIVGIKVDVDTERGTRLGAVNLKNLFLSLEVPATFLFTLGPDNTGRALKRIFRPGFLKKVSRTSVLKLYGIKTLLNGVLWPGPHIAQRHAAIMRDVQQQGFEVGIHSYDHTYWQDGVTNLSEEKIEAEFQRACDAFKSVFHVAAKTAGAAGWQANAKTLRVYDRQHLDYASDCRGTHPFFPRVEGHIFSTLQLPTTLPTLDELLGDPAHPENTLVDHFIRLLTPQHPNIFTIHAELEGMHYLNFMEAFIRRCKAQGVQFQSLTNIAKAIRQHENTVPVCEFIQDTLPGRSGFLSMQA